jgi:hypothetical protein
VINIIFCQQIAKPYVVSEHGQFSPRGNRGKIGIPGWRDLSVFTFDTIIESFGVIDNQDFPTEILEMAASKIFTHRGAEQDEPSGYQTNPTPLKAKKAFPACPPRHVF